MVNVVVFVFLITALILILQKKIALPGSISLLATVFILNAFGIHPIDISSEGFDSLLFVLLPVLIAIDVLALRLDDLKKHSLSLFYSAVIAVALSVFAGVFLNKVILPDVDLTIPALIALFCMCMATDPISVSAVFSNFKIPHTLKVLTEGESLFNDATALILFGLAITFMGTTHASLSEVTIHAVMVVVGAIMIGLATGFVGLFLLRQTDDSMVETAIMLGTIFGSFAAAEYFHWSGILAIIVATVTANHTITKRIEKDEWVIKDSELRNDDASKATLKASIVDKQNHTLMLQYIKYTAVLATTVLFLSMGELVQWNLLIEHWKTILTVFAATTLIRFVMMAKFAFVSNFVPYMHQISTHWWSILALAGVKGGLSLLMLHMMPKDFEHLELFESIVVGHILLSTFIFPFLIMAVMKRFAARFNEEYKADPAHH